MQWRSAFATTAGALPGVPPQQAAAQARRAPGSGRRVRPDRALDLRRGDAGRDGAVRTLYYPAGDVLVVSGLPGSGKSTLIRQAVAEAGVRCLDSQDVRERYERRVSRRVPYVLYRPVVRVAHYRALFRAVRARESLVVHDCGSMAWVRHWVARQARRQRRGMHLLLLDVPPTVAEEGQRARGRAVSAYAFARHRRASARLVGAAEDAAERLAAAGAPAGAPEGGTAGRRSGGARRSALPKGCVSAVLIDRCAAGALQEIRFGE